MRSARTRSMNWLPRSWIGALGADIPFAVDNISLVGALDQWRGNQCSDAFYCPPMPSCSKGGDPICGPDGLVYSTGS